MAWTCVPVSRLPAGATSMSGTGTAAFGSVCVVAVVVVAAAFDAGFDAPAVCAGARAAPARSSPTASAAIATARSAALQGIARGYSGRPEVGADHRRHIGDRPAPQAVFVGLVVPAEPERAERVAAVRRAGAA